MSSLIKIYKERLKELGENPIIVEYESLKTIIGALPENDSNNYEVVMPKNISTKTIENKNEIIAPFNGGVVLNILNILKRGVTREEINSCYKERYNGKKDLKYVIRTQYKNGNLLLFKVNKSHKYSFYVLPHWLDNGVLLNEYMPKKSRLPNKITDKFVKMYDEK